MWPTFFMPLMAIQERNGQVDHLCGTDTCGSGNPFDVPNPLSLAAGNSQVIVVSYYTNDVPVWPDATDGWSLIFDTSTVQGNGTWSGNQKVFYRIWNGTDPDFQVTIPSGSLSGAWLSMSLANANDADPIFSGYIFLAESYPVGVMSIQGDAQYLECANTGDVFLQVSSSEGDFTSAQEPATADVEFACTNTSVPTNWGHTLSAIYAARQANNLIPYSKVDPSGWTLNALTRDTATAYSTKVKPALRLYTSGGSSKHYAECSVDLEAGKSYAFVMSYFANNGAGAYWMTYEKPDTSEHGVGFNAARNVKATLSGSTEVSASVKTDNVECLIQGDNIMGYFGSTAGIMIRADTTGTYKLRIHISANTSTDPNTNNSPSASAILWIQDVALIEGPSVSIIPTMLPTSGAAILPGQAAYVRPTPFIENYPFSPTGWFSLAVRRAGGSRPVCRLMECKRRGVLLDFGDNNINDSRLLAAPEIDDPYPLRTSHAVYSQLADKKFYLELYVSSWGTGSTNDDYSIGMCPFEAATNNSSASSSTPTGGWPGQYVYCSTGKTFTNGTVDGSTIAAWQVGDYVGVGLDLTDNEITFYLNGTLVKTMAINSSQYDRLWVGLFGFFSDYSLDKQARMTYNFRGPFGGRKPSGFAAFDFDNELT